MFGVCSSGMYIPILDKLTNFTDPAFHFTPRPSRISAGETTNLGGPVTASLYTVGAARGETG